MRMEIRTFTISNPRGRAPKNKQTGPADVKSGGRTSESWGRGVRREGEGAGTEEEERRERRHGEGRRKGEGRGEGRRKGEEGKEGGREGWEGLVPAPRAPSCPDGSCTNTPTLGATTSPLLPPLQPCAKPEIWEGKHRLSDGLKVSLCWVVHVLECAFVRVDVRVFRNLVCVNAL